MKKIHLLFLLAPLIGFSQLEDNFKLNADNVKALITKYKKDPRGPYKDLRWFCDDGTINPPSEPCENGGVQHARYKDEVLNLGKESHIYFGQILASMDKEAFWDADHQNARLKEYQLEKYLILKGL